MSLLIKMKDIVKTFNIGQPGELTVLHKCNFYVKDGEFVSVVGQSGSGKSTLMNIIGLLDAPTSGKYVLGGVNVLNAQPDELARYRSESIGFVFQNFNLIGRMNAQKNVEMPMMYAGVSPKKRAARARELLELVGMGDRVGHEPNELSGGQKQRVAIARALANEPKLLLADEPTGALDSHTGRMVMDMFHKLNNEEGKTIVFITHNPELAQETDRIITITDGHIDNPNGAPGLGRAPRAEEEVKTR